MQPLQDLIFHFIKPFSFCLFYFIHQPSILISQRFSQVANYPLLFKKHNILFLSFSNNKLFKKPIANNFSMYYFLYVQSSSRQRFIELYLKVNESRYIALCVASGSIKNISLLIVSIFTLLDH